MFAHIRYPFFGCLALLLTACGSSGSQTVVSLPPSPSNDAITGDYDAVEYLLSDSEAISAARGEFVSAPPENTDATAPSENVLELNTRRARIVRDGTRYLTTGSLLMETDDAQDISHVMTPVATDCMDGTGATEANCGLGADALRDMVTFHLGQTNTNDSVDDVGFQNFSASRQPVMDYRGIRMSQVKSTGTDTETSEADPVMNPYEYVGYDGMLQYSMFFVGVYRFFDDGMGDSEPVLEHQRLENASFGQRYDQDDGMSGVQNPTASLTGVGVMVGMESENDTLNSHLVQGDVNIDYMVDPSDLISIEIENVRRLVGDVTAWYAETTELLWGLLPVTGSEFSEGGADADKKLRGSFYGTGINYEVGGTFYHKGNQYSIIGAFGSELEP